MGGRPMKAPEHKGDNESKPLYERQLDEILRGVERTQRRRQFWEGLQRSVRRLRAPRKAGVGFPYSRLIGLALALAVGGMVLRGLLPGFGGLGSLLILGGVVLFLSPILLSLGRPRGGGGAAGGDDKLWRGRPVIYHDDPWQTTRARLNDWVRRLRGDPPNRPPPPTSRGRWN